MIGNVFVQQYYSIMSTTLDELYKFYNNGSTLHVCGVGVPPLPGADAMGDQTVRTQAGIHARFNQLGYRGKRCEVRTVDSSHSIGGSVVVMVTGAITDGGVDRRAFTQTFVLAPQEGGYYVLNDLVRFLGNNEGADVAAVAADTAVSAPVKAPEPPVTAPPAPTRPTGAVSLEELEARMNAAAPNVHVRAAAAADVVKEAAEAAAAAEVVKEAAAAIVEPETDAKEPEGPTTYASIAAKMRAAAAAKAPNAVSKAKPAAPAKAPIASSADPAPAHKTTHEKLTHDPVTAVFVRNIPQSADEASIEAAFAKIGPIATVTIRTAKRAPDASGDAATASDKPAGRYAFVQFERAESAQAAIEAVIEMDGRALSVEEKRETSGGHRNQGQGGGANGRGKMANNNAGRGGNQRDGRQQGTRGPRRDGEGGKNQGQGERRAQGGPRAQGGERRQPARQPAAAKA